MTSPKELVKKPTHREEGVPLLSLRTPPYLAQLLGCSFLSISPLPSPTKELHRKLSSDEMYLLDSGGQYWYVFHLIPAWPGCVSSDKNQPKVSLLGRGSCI